ncbi:HD domain-containing protein [Candidatus Omnitrophota bacterium]
MRVQKEEAIVDEGVLKEKEKGKERLDLEVITAAREIGDIAHGRQMRANGEPYLIHPVAILTLLVLGDVFGGRLRIKDAEELSDEIIFAVALLHDVIEEYRPDRYKAGKNQDAERKRRDEARSLIWSVFLKHGVQEPVIETILAGVEKLTQQEDETEEAYLQRLSRSETPYVILIKIFDRLHNLQTPRYKWTVNMARSYLEDGREFVASIERKLLLGDYRSFDQGTRIILWKAIALFIAETDYLYTSELVKHGLRQPDNYASSPAAIEQASSPLQENRLSGLTEFPRPSEQDIYRHIAHKLAIDWDRWDGVLGLGRFREVGRSSLSVSSPAKPIDAQRLRRLLYEESIYELGSNKDIKYGSLELAITELGLLSEREPGLQEDIDLLIKVLSMSAEEAVPYLAGIDRTILKIATNFNTKQWTTDVRMGLLRMVLGELSFPASTVIKGPASASSPVNSSRLRKELIPRPQAEGPVPGRIVTVLQEGRAYAVLDHMIREKITQLKKQGKERRVIVVIDGYPAQGKTSFTRIFLKLAIQTQPVPLFGMPDARGRVLFLDVGTEVFDIVTGRSKEDDVMLQQYLDDCVTTYSQFTGEQIDVVILSGSYCSQVVRLASLGDIFVEIINLSNYALGGVSIYAEVNKNFEFNPRLTERVHDRPVVIPQLTIITFPPYPSQEEVLAWVRKIAKRGEGASKKEGASSPVDGYFAVWKNELSQLGLWDELIRQSPESEWQRFLEIFADIKSGRKPSFIEIALIKKIAGEYLVAIRGLVLDELKKGGFDLAHVIEEENRVIALVYPDYSPSSQQHVSASFEAEITFLGTHQRTLVKLINFHVNVNFYYTPCEVLYGLLHESLELKHIFRLRDSYPYLTPRDLGRLCFHSDYEGFAVTHYLTVLEEESFHSIWSPTERYRGLREQDHIAIESLLIGNEAAIRSILGHNLPPELARLFSRTSSPASERSQRHKDTKSHDTRSSVSGVAYRVSGVRYPELGSSIEDLGSSPASSPAGQRRDKKDIGCDFVSVPQLTRRRSPHEKVFIREAHSRFRARQGAWEGKKRRHVTHQLLQRLGGKTVAEIAEDPELGQILRFIMRPVTRHIPKNKASSPASQVTNPSSLATTVVTPAHRLSEYSDLYSGHKSTDIVEIGGRGYLQIRHPRICPPMRFTHVVKRLQMLFQNPEQGWDIVSQFLMFHRINEYTKDGMRFAWEVIEALRDTEDIARVTTGIAVRTEIITERAESGRQERWVYVLYIEDNRRNASSPIEGWAGALRSAQDSLQHDRRGQGTSSPVNSLLLRKELIPRPQAEGPGSRIAYRVSGVGHISSTSSSISTFFPTPYTLRITHYARRTKEVLLCLTSKVSGLLEYYRRMREHLYRLDILIRFMNTVSWLRREEALRPRPFPESGSIWEETPASSSSTSSELSSSGKILVPPVPYAGSFAGQENGAGSFNQQRISVRMPIYR